MASNKNKNAKNTPAKKSKLSKKAKRIIVVISVVVMALLLLGGTLLIVLQNKDENYELLSEQKKVVAICNDFEISYDELYFVTQLYKNSLEHAYGEGIWDDPVTAEQHRAELETLVMENLNENYLILSACRTLSIPIDSDEKNDYINKTMEEMLSKDFGGDEEKMLQSLEDEGLSERYMRFLIGVEYLQSTIYYTLLDMGFYTYTTENIGDFMDYVATSENYARTLHVYVQNDEGDDIEANRQKAQRMHDYLAAEPDAASREALMREYIGAANNEDFSITEYGYYFTYGEMDEVYEEATFALAIGDVSEVVETDTGFYVIMRLAPDPDYIPKIASNLLPLYQSAAMGTYIRNYDESCKVTFNEYGKSLDLVKLTQFRVTEPTEETQATRAAES